MPALSRPVLALTSLAALALACVSPAAAQDAAPLDATPPEAPVESDEAPAPERTEPPSAPEVGAPDAETAAMPTASTPEADAAIPPGYGTGLASPAPTRAAVVVDDERPPGVGRGASPEPPPTTAPRTTYPEDDLPIRVAARPLTLTAGTMRFDHTVLLRTGAFGMVAQMAFQLALGITDDVEVSLLWPIARDPTLQGTWRVFSDGTFDLGVRAAIQAPIVTEGNTDTRIGVPIVLRGGPVRFWAAAELDVLFTANVSTILAVPAQLTVSASRSFAFGAQGWIGVLDGRHPVGDVQGFITMTAWAVGRPVVDVRFAAGYAPAENDVIFTHAVTVYPQLW